MSHFKSKIGPELAIPVAVLLFAGLMLSSASKNWIGVLIIFLVMIFVLHVFLTTYYEINGNILKIKCGFLIDKEVNIDDIVSIKETFNPLSAPATSLDRLEIKLRGKDSILVSPKDKREFINELVKIKPGIAVIMRADKNKTAN
ncbi:PH domain-containing protein [Flavitalea sp.]|nr:PH domain-containing protein [Flavitalea sp.]